MLLQLPCGYVHMLHIMHQILCIDVDEDEYQIDIEMEDLGYNIKEQDRQPLTSPLANSSLSANSPLSSVILRPPSPRSDRLRKLDHRMVRDVLDTRPTLQLGRSMSMRFRARSAFSKRPISTHSSMPQMIRCRSAGGKNRKKYIYRHYLILCNIYTGKL